VVLELLTGAKSNAQICREHHLAPTVVSAWKDRFVDRAPGIFSTQQSASAEQQRIAELERLLGRLTLELEVAKKASSILSSLSPRSGR
jgi:transposase